jgi:molecular chaperone Hsp33
MQDCLHRFLFEGLAIRGEIVHLDAAWQTVLARRTYPSPVRRVLGEALAAAALLSATIKFDGMLSLQLQGQGPLRLLLAECSSERTLRGLARWEGAADPASLAELCGDGVLAITIDPGQERYRYQGMVEVSGATLETTLTSYFSRSEQLPTRLKLVAGQHAVAGLMLQCLPDRTEDRDGWNRIETLAATLTSAELLELDARTLIRRLFHEEDVRLFETQPLRFRCHCSRQRVATMLRALGTTELQTLLAEQGKVEVACEFCGLRYDFDAVDVGGLLASLQPAVPDTHH